jgi:hypothetical protein
MFIKPRTLLFLVLILQLFPSVVFSQTLSAPAPVSDFAVASVGKMSFFEKAATYERAILYTGASEAIMLVLNHDNTNSLAKIDKEGKVLWTRSLAKDLYQIALLDGKILLVTRDLKENFIKNINATLYDPADGRELAKKVIYTNPDNTYTQVITVADRNGVLNGVLLVRTVHKGKLRGFADFNLVESLQLLKLDASLSATSTTLPIPAEEKMRFYQVSAGAGGTLYTCFGTAEGIYVQAHHANGTLKGRFLLPVEAKRGGDKFPAWNELLEEDPQQLGLVRGAMDLDGKYQLYTIDFEKKVKKVTEQAVNKAFATTFERIALPTLPGNKPINDFYNYRLSRIVPNGRSMVLVLEHQHIGSSGSGALASNDYSAYSFVYLFYDENLKLQKSLAIDRTFDVSAPIGVPLGHHVYNGKLYTTGNYQKTARQVESFLAVVDLEKQTIEKLERLDRFGSGKAILQESAATLYFQNTMLLSFIEDAANIMMLKKSTHWQKLTL